MTTSSLTLLLLDKATTRRSSPRALTSSSRRLSKKSSLTSSKISALYFCKNLSARQSTFFTGNNNYEGFNEINKSKTHDLVIILFFSIKKGLDCATDNENFEDPPRKQSTRPSLRKQSSQRDQKSRSLLVDHQIRDAKATLESNAS